MGNQNKSNEGYLESAVKKENTMSFTMRLFQDEDAEKLSQIIRSDLEQINSKDYDAEVIVAMTKHFSPETLKQMAREREVFVIEVESEVAGIISLIENKIFSVFVDPTLQGKGVGKKMMNYIEQVIKDRGYGYVELPSSITAHEFYKKLGYEDVRESVSEETGKTIIMRKEFK